MFQSLDKAHASVNKGIVDSFHRLNSAQVLVQVLVDLVHYELNLSVGQDSPSLGNRPDQLLGVPDPGLLVHVLDGEVGGHQRPPERGRVPGPGRDTHPGHRGQELDGEADALVGQVTPGLSLDVLQLAVIEILTRGLEADQPQCGMLEADPRVLRSPAPQTLVEARHGGLQLLPLPSEEIGGLDGVKDNFFLEDLTLF